MDGERTQLAAFNDAKAAPDAARCAIDTRRSTTASKFPASLRLSGAGERHGARVTNAANDFDYDGEETRRGAINTGGRGRGAHGAKQTAPGKRKQARLINGARLASGAARARRSRD